MTLITISVDANHWLQVLPGINLISLSTTALPVNSLTYEIGGQERE